jgi:hypothetical protein
LNQWYNYIKQYICGIVNNILEKSDYLRRSEVKAVTSQARNCLSANKTLSALPPNILSPTAFAVGDQRLRRWIMTSR